MGAIHEIWERRRDHVDFYVVYIKEAHPEDGWVLNVNREQDIVLDDATSDDERHEAASACALRLEIKLPVVIDPIDNHIASAYGALPDRLYLVGRGGKIAFQGDRGPMGFRPHELEAAIETELERLAVNR